MELTGSLSPLTTNRPGNNSSPTGSLVLRQKSYCETRDHIDLTNYKTDKYMIEAKAKSKIALSTTWLNKAKSRDLAH